MRWWSGDDNDTRNSYDEGRPQPDLPTGAVAPMLDRRLRRGQSGSVEGIRREDATDLRCVPGGIASMLRLIMQNAAQRAETDNDQQQDERAPQATCEASLPQACALPCSTCPLL